MLNSGSEIVIRADASSKLGIGHIIRCMALADGLSSVGCCITFFSVGILVICKL